MTNRIPLSLALLACTVVPGATLIPVAPAAAQMPPIRLLCRPNATSLTGTWMGNDGGVYRVRQVQNAIYWVGMSANDHGAGWTHVVYGSRSGDVITTKWADVNGPMGSGRLTVRVTDGAHMVRTAATGSGFGGTKWHRAGCRE